MRDRFKKAVKAAGLSGTVRANKAGCLGQCEAGVAVVVYPEQVWYGGVTVDDVDEIVERHLVRGEYVARLMLPGQTHLDGALGGESRPESAGTGHVPDAALPREGLEPDG